jgi:leader peptidase (prepilin peptidase)/N-methyltransferase
VPGAVSLLIAFTVGVTVGSFLNVCIHRWPQDESVVRPRSRCPRCGARLQWFDLVPLVSYFSLRGRCRYCRAGISMRYPIVEFLNGLIYACVLARVGWEPLALKMAVFASMMLVLVFTDIEEFILPDEITLGGLALGIGLSPFLLLKPGLTTIFWFLLGFGPPLWLASLLESVLAAAMLGGLLWATGEAYFRLRQLEGLGLGDVKMIAMIGAFWGAAMGFTTLVLSAIVGAVTGVLIVLIARKDWTYALPFGSYLGATAIIVTLWGNAIADWYWRTVR